MLRRAFSCLCMILLILPCMASSEDLFFPVPEKAPTAVSFSEAVGREEVLPQREGNTQFYEYEQVSEDEYALFGKRLHDEGYLVLKAEGNEAMFFLDVSNGKLSFSIEYSSFYRTLRTIYPLTVLVETRNDSALTKPEGDLAETKAYDTVPIESVIGTTVSFGHWPQRKDAENVPEPIEWLVLSYVDGKMLLLTKKAVEVKKYHNTWENTMTWERCSLRKWLNEDFLNAAFSEKELPFILLSSVNAQANPSSPRVNPGNDTLDYVFLLSYAEAELYLDQNARIAFPNENAVLAKADGGSTEKPTRWWLRTPGSNGRRAAVIDAEGQYSYNDITYAHNCVRPAIWVSLPE